MGVQSDERFARDFVAAKWRAAHWSPGKLKYALSQKGVSSGDADDALAWLQEVRAPP
jgi:SOS response regulatory protein OraA/RecX